MIENNHIKKIYRWKSDFADNGWLDWFCPDCGKKVWNDDVHVSLNWNYCPYCGSKIIEEQGHVEDIQEEDGTSSIQIRNQHIV